MKLPQSLNAYNVTKENIEEFKGLDHNERAQNGAWYDMENMTLDDYPVASVRNKRGIVTSDYENTISNNDLTIQTRRGAFDAAIVNGNVSLLQNCAMQQGGTVTAEGQILRIHKTQYIHLPKAILKVRLHIKTICLRSFRISGVSMAEESRYAIYTDVGLNTERKTAFPQMIFASAQSLPLLTTEHRGRFLCSYLKRKVQ